MQNVNMKIDAATVQRIVERHINETLVPGVMARVSMIGGNSAVLPVPGSPNYELIVSFDVVPNPERNGS